MKQTNERATTAITLAVLTVSDSLNQSSDTSADFLVQALEAQHHILIERKLIPDSLYQIRAVISQWIAEPSIQVILITGGTGFTENDNTPEAILPLMDREVPGFGELFRALSYQDVASSTVQSRAVAGMANKTLIFAMPGSTKACQLAWEKIIQPQLDSQLRCNFVTHI